jgi:hypothetical protein
LRADGREDRVLDFLEVGLHRRNNGNRLTVLVEAFAVAGGARRQNQHDRGQKKSFYGH